MKIEENKGIEIKEEKWKGEFMKRFVYNPPAEKGNYGGTLLKPFELKTPEGGIYEVMEFISNLLLSQRQQLEAELNEELPREKDCVELPETCTAHSNLCHHDGFNNCLDEVKALISRVINEK